MFWVTLRDSLPERSQAARMRWASFGRVINGELEEDGLYGFPCRARVVYEEPQLKVLFVVGAIDATWTPEGRHPGFCRDTSPGESKK